MNELPPGTYVVGLGHAATAPARDDVNTTELAWEAVSAALADAGIALRDVGGAVTASQDFWEGRTISSMAVNEIAGGTLRSESKVAADGALALFYATTRIEDGDQSLNLVVAHSKESQADAHGVEMAAFDPYYQRALDPDETVAAALQADQLYARGEYGPGDAARLVAAARGRSRTLDSIGAEDVLASAPTADPLRELDRAPYMDAATCLVVCDGATAAKLGRPAVRVVAGASRTGAYWTDRDLTAAPELAQAVDEALELAGWERDSLDHIEISAPFAHQSLLLAAELGLGRGEELVVRFEGADGDRPTLNASGGWHAGSAGSVAGLAAAAAATERLRGGGRALVHGSTGLCAQSHTVLLLEGVA